MDDLESRKRALRDQMKRRPPAAEGASVAAQERLLRWPRFAGARTVGLYRALRSEVQTSLLAAQPKTIAHPVVTEGSRVLAFRAGDDFVRGPLGFDEPAGPEVPLERIELLIVPALAVDETGRRLGRGKGFYDATLARFSGITVALVFESQVVPEVPAGEHDVRVSAVCTEARLFEVKR